MPVQIWDDVANLPVIDVADNGNVGINCNADGTELFFVGGILVLRSNARFAAGSCPSYSVAPTAGSTTVPASSTVQVSTTVADAPIVSASSSLESNDGSYAFYIKNDQPYSTTIEWCYW